MPAILAAMEQRSNLFSMTSEKVKSDFYVFGHSRSPGRLAIMDSRFLHTFTIVAERGSIAEAARHLGLTPTSVAQRLRASLRVTPNPDVTIDLVGTYDQQRNGGTPFISARFPASAGSPGWSPRHRKSGRSSPA